jgi:hypothetical protein
MHSNGLIIGNLLALGAIARLAQSAERKALNLVVVGSSPTVGVCTGRPTGNPRITSMAAMHLIRWILLGDYCHSGPSTQTPSR